METAQSLSLSDIRNALFHTPFLPSSLQRSCISYGRITTRDQNRLQHGSKVSARHPFFEFQLAGDNSITGEKEPPPANLCYFPSHIHKAGIEHKHQARVPRSMVSANQR